MLKLISRLSGFLMLPQRENAEEAYHRFTKDLKVKLSKRNRFDAIQTNVSTKSKSLCTGFDKTADHARLFAFS